MSKEAATPRFCEYLGAIRTARRSCFLFLQEQCLNYLPHGHKDSGSPRVPGFLNTAVFLAKVDKVVLMRWMAPHLTLQNASEAGFGTKSLPSGPYIDSFPIRVCVVTDPGNFDDEDNQDAEPHDAGMRNNNASKKPAKEPRLDNEDKQQNEATRPPGGVSRRKAKEQLEKQLPSVLQQLLDAGEIAGYNKHSQTREIVVVEERKLAKQLNGDRPLGDSRHNFLTGHDWYKRLVIAREDLHSVISDSRCIGLQLIRFVCESISVEEILLWAGLLREKDAPNLWIYVRASEMTKQVEAHIAQTDRILDVGSQLSDPYFVSAYYEGTGQPTSGLDMYPVHSRSRAFLCSGQCRKALLRGYASGHSNQTRCPIAGSQKHKACDVCEYGVHSPADFRFAPFSQSSVPGPSIAEAEEQRSMRASSNPAAEHQVITPSPMLPEPIHSSPPDWTYGPEFSGSEAARWSPMVPELEPHAEIVHRDQVRKRNVAPGTTPTEVVSQRTKTAKTRPSVSLVTPRRKFPSERERTGPPGLMRDSDESPPVANLLTPAQYILHDANRFRTGILDSECGYKPLVANQPSGDSAHLFENMLPLHKSNPDICVDATSLMGTGPDIMEWSPSPSLERAGGTRNFREEADTALAFPRTQYFPDTDDDPEYLNEIGKLLDQAQRDALKQRPPKTVQFDAFCSDFTDRTGRYVSPRQELTRASGSSRAAKINMLTQIHSSKPSEKSPQRGLNTGLSDVCLLGTQYITDPDDSGEWLDQAVKLTTKLERSATGSARFLPIRG